MKRIKALLFIITVIGNMTMLTGCWDYTEINQMAIVMGIAIDKNEVGQGYSVTVEVVDLRGAGKDVKIQSKRIEAQGMTLQDALRNIIKVSGKTLYFSHVEVVIISNSAAKQGILPVLDMIFRQRQPRLSIHIFISKEESAKTLLSHQSITTDIRSLEMREMINSEKGFLSKAPHADVRKVIDDLSGEGIAATLPMIGIVLNEGKKTSELSGTAIFKQDRIIGTLDEEDTKFFLFTKNEVRGGVLVFRENLKDFGKDITFDIKGSKTKVSPVYTNGKLSMKVEVNTKLSLGELGVSENLIGEKGREKLKIEAEKTIKINIERVIDKVKADYNSDIFGFGRIVKYEKPSLWKNIGKDWSSIFGNLPVNVTANVEIVSSELSSNPIQVGD